MQETIERARIAEAFMNASTAAGLSDDLDNLVKLVDQDEDGEGQPLHSVGHFTQMYNFTTHVFYKKPFLLHLEMLYLCNYLDPLYHLS